MNNPCIQCGMCCMVAPCPFGEDADCGPTGECGYLTVDSNGDAICNCSGALDWYVGSGCMFQAPGAEGVYLLHLNEYSIEERRIALQEEGHHVQIRKESG
jgi:hypothetical protein